MQVRLLFTLWGLFFLSPTLAQVQQGHNPHRYTAESFGVADPQDPNGTIQINWLNYDFRRNDRIGSRPVVVPVDQANAAEESFIHNNCDYLVGSEATGFIVYRVTCESGE